MQSYIISSPPYQNDQGLKYGGMFPFCYTPPAHKLHKQVPNPNPHMEIRIDNQYKQRKVIADFSCSLDCGESGLQTYASDHNKIK